MVESWADPRQVIPKGDRVLPATQAAVRSPAHVVHGTDAWGQVNWSEVLIDQGRVNEAGLAKRSGEAARIGADASPGARALEAADIQEDLTSL